MSNRFFGQFKGRSQGIDYLCHYPVALPLGEKNKGDIPPGDNAQADNQHTDSDRKRKILVFDHVFNGRQIDPFNDSLKSLLNFSTQAFVPGCKFAVFFLRLRQGVIQMAR